MKKTIKTFILSFIVSIGIFFGYIVNAAWNDTVSNGGILSAEKWNEVILQIGDNLTTINGLTSSFNDLTYHLSTLGELKLTTGVTINNISNDNTLSDGSNSISTTEAIKTYITNNTSNVWQLNGVKTYYNGGNVGIGTNDPTSKFQTVGQIESTSAGFSSKFTDTWWSGLYKSRLTDDSRQWYFGIRNGAGSNSFSFQHYNGSSWLGDTLTLKGNDVGINNTNPSYGLDIIRPTMRLSSSTSGDAIFVIESDTDNNDENDNPRIVLKQDGGVEEAGIGLGIKGIGGEDNILGISSGVSAGGIKMYTTSTNGYKNGIERLYIEPGGNINFWQNNGSWTKIKENTTYNGSDFEQISETEAWADTNTYRLKTNTYNWNIVNNRLGYSQYGTPIRNGISLTSQKLSEFKYNTTTSLWDYTLPINGNVGIGTDGVLSSKLTVNGDIKLLNGTNINNFSIDGTLSGNSNLTVPTEQAIKTYVDSKAGGSLSNGFSLNSYNYGAISNGGLIQYSNVIDIPAGSVINFQIWAGRSNYSGTTHSSLEYSNDNGATWNTYRIVSMPGSGTWNVSTLERVIISKASQKWRIKVESTDGSFNPIAYMNAGGYIDYQ